MNFIMSNAISSLRREPIRAVSWSMVPPERSSNSAMFSIAEIGGNFSIVPKRLQVYNGRPIKGERLANHCYNEIDGYRTSDPRDSFNAEPPNASKDSNRSREKEAG